MHRQQSRRRRPGSCGSVRPRGEARPCFGGSHFPRGRGLLHGSPARTAFGLPAHCGRRVRRQQPRRRGRRRCAPALRVFRRFPECKRGRHRKLTASLARHACPSAPISSNGSLSGAAKARASASAWSTRANAACASGCSARTRPMKFQTDSFFGAAVASGLRVQVTSAAAIAARHRIDIGNTHAVNGKRPGQRPGGTRVEWWLD